MAIFTAPMGLPLDTSLNLQNFLHSSSYFQIFTQTSSRLVIGIGEDRYSFTGTGVRYNTENQPIAGTITGLEWSNADRSMFSISGLNIPAATFYQSLSGSGSSSAYALLFPGNDEMRGGALDDFVVDGGGHNNMFGGAGADTLVAGDGNDHIYGQSAVGGDDGDDRIYGGGGADYLQGNAGNDTINGQDGSDRIQGGAGDDLIGGGIGNDTINGNRGNDTIESSTGNDFVRGGQGDDLIRGFSGQDQLFGDLGNDTLWGGGDGDTLTGGEGSDHFQIFGAESPEFTVDYRARDANGLPSFLNVITDFHPGEDKIAAFSSAAITVAPSQATVAAATAYIRSIDTDNIVAVSVGSDTYLFYGTRTEGVDYDYALLLRNVNPSTLTTDDFEGRFYFGYSYDDVG